MEVIVCPPSFPRAHERTLLSPHHLQQTPFHPPHSTDINDSSKYHLITDSSSAARNGRPATSQASAAARRRQEGYEGEARLLRRGNRCIESPGHSTRRDDRRPRSPSGGSSAVSRAHAGRELEDPNGRTQRRFLGSVGHICRGSGVSCYPSRFLTWLVAHPNLELDVR